ncbi:MAG: hypothetical protein ACRD2C_26065 [Acidimicrobiales bacterium]
MSQPTFLLADLYAQGSLRRIAHSALPDAPVASEARRWRRLRRSRRGESSA